MARGRNGPGLVRCVSASISGMSATVSGTASSSGAAARLSSTSCTLATWAATAQPAGGDAVTPLSGTTRR